MTGFYDSGIGGLSILEQVLVLDPDFSYCFLADLASLPLGEKSVDFIQGRVKTACSYLFAQGCDLVVLACNTASVNSIRHLQRVWLPQFYPDKQVLSITRPITEYLEQNYSRFKDFPGLILATTATHRSGFYQHEFLKAKFKKLQSVPCNGLAEAIEANNIVAVKNLLETYIETNRILVADIKYILLACTHYKYAIEEIQTKFSKATIIDPSLVCAQKLVEYLVKHPQHSYEQTKSKFWVTKETRFSKVKLQSVGLTESDINLILL